jgi:glycosyltransferase involved in cell wall biosynthesis
LIYKNVNFLHVIASVDPATGGPVEVLRVMSNILIAKGHSVETVSLDDATILGRVNFPFAITAVGGWKSRYRYSPHFATWVKRNAKRFDVIIMHGIWNYSSLGAWRGLRSSTTPYFLYPHGMLDPWFRKSNPMKHWFKQLYWLAAEGRVLRDAEAVLFTCEEEQLLASKSFWGYSYKANVVGLGTAEAPGDAHVQIASFKTKYPALNGRRFVLFLGRIHPKKGCDLLINAFGYYASAYPNLDLVVAGPDQVGWQTALVAQAGQAGLSHRIHWLGMLNGDEKWGVLRSADALALPSHQENFGIVVAEAMACSTPVLITDKVNIWREIRACGGGLVGSDDELGIRDLLGKFLSLDESARRSMACNARNGFLKYFTADHAVKELVSLTAKISSLSGD